MLKKIKDRLKEASTWIGLGLFTLAMDKLFKLDHAEGVAQAFDAASGAAAHSDDLVAISVTLVSSLAGIFMKERK
jgi:hypothetical protein